MDIFNKTELEDAIIAFMMPWEGTDRRGNVPWRRNPATGDKEPIMSSGVTIGMGCDLGQQTEKSLVEMGLPKDLVAKFRPYLGLTRYAAMDYLEAHPLSITKDEERTLNRAVVGLYITYAQREYDLSKPAHKFWELSTGRQIALTSLRFHMGVGKAAYPKTFRYLSEGKWSQAALELMTASCWPKSWPKNFIARRYAEGEQVLRGA